MFQKSADSEMAGFQMVPLWVPGIFLNHVWKYGISYISCSSRCGKFEGSIEIVLDFPRALGMDLYTRTCTGLGGTVCVWIL
mgnify:CR=1 FL=1